MNRKADFLTKRIDSHNESNRFESRIGMLCFRVSQTRKETAYRHVAKGARDSKYSLRTTKVSYLPANSIVLLNSSLRILRTCRTPASPYRSMRAETTVRK